MVTIPVHYPYGGAYYMLQWWTEYDRGHLALAKSRQCLEQTAYRIFQEHPYCKILSYNFIEIGTPPTWFCKQVHEAKRRREIHTFKYVLTSALKEVIETKTKLPKIFKLCTEYTSDDGTDNEWDKEHHSNCVNCCNRIRVLISDDELYDRYHTQWRFKPEIKYKSRSSQADVLSNNRDLWAARTNFGHHAAGIELVKIDDPDQIYEDQILFFYHQFRKLSSASLNAMLKGVHAKEIQRRKQNEKDQKNERITERNNRIKILLDVFNS